MSVVSKTCTLSCPLRKLHWNMFDRWRRIKMLAFLLAHPRWLILLKVHQPQLWCALFVSFSVFIFLNQDPFRQLKDLSLLKDQLDNIQRRVEDEVGVGIPQGGSVLSSPFLKGFLAGYVVAKLRSSAVLGVLVGTCTGIYAAQSYQVPNVEQTIKNYFSSFKKR